jgi:hypothetical protein
VAGRFGCSLLGIGTELGRAPFGNLIIAGPPDQTGVAGAVNTVMRLIGGAVGAQLAMTCLPSGSHGGHLSPQGLALSPAVAAGAEAAAFGPALLIPKPNPKDTR